MMNAREKIIVCGTLLIGFLIISCEREIELDIPSGNTPHFYLELRGTWVSNDKTVYDGKLVIGIDRITINGFYEDQTPSVGGDDNRRPFKDFTKGVALKGYAEDGKIFIEDRGMLQAGIPYTYVHNRIGQVDLIYFTFGGRTEAMQRQ